MIWRSGWRRRRGRFARCQRSGGRFVLSCECFCAEIPRPLGRDEVFMKRQMYKMCELTKPVEGGVARMISWIRAEVALPGRLLDRLEDTDTGRIENGWRVESVALPAYPENVLMQR